MRLIDADALSHEMYHQAFETDSNMQKWDGCCWIRYKMFEKCRDNAPTIDAVEVVRCRDCKWWNGYYRECESPNWNTGTDEYIVQPAGMFCGWGERRTDANS